MSGFSRQHEKLEELVRQAWMLSDAEIDSLRPGMADEAISLLDQGQLLHTPFANRTRYDIEQPDVHLLRLMRTPEFFPFTCYHLLGKPSGGEHLELLPFQHLILTELWYRQFPMLVASRGCGKTFATALYALLRMLFCPGSKIVIVASSFRQAKQTFEYMERLWYGSPVLRDLVGNAPGVKGRSNGPRRDIDRCEFIIGDSVTIALPLGTGETIRGLRANYVIVDEFSSVSETIYAVVVQGFGAVTADPVQNVKDAARVRILKRLALWTEEMDEEEAKMRRGNQSILSGTADYGFKHFARYWREYRGIINTKGERRELEEVLKGPVPEAFDWRDYSIVRLPYNMVPHGYMDEKTIVRAKQTSHTSHYKMEYLAVFINDSEGFFRRSLIEKCVVGNPDNPSPATFKSCGLVDFVAAVKGDSRKRYVYGVDPAYNSDNFAVVVLELWPEHRRVVHVWTTQKSRHKSKLKKGSTKEHDFYRFCVRKLRDLMKDFPCDRILLDAGSGGGGTAIMEAFGDPSGLNEGETAIYEVPDPDFKKHKDTDDMPGQHIIELVHFRNNAWVSEANHGMKKDLEGQLLLFPAADAAVLGLAQEDDRDAGRFDDSLEEVLHEVEQLKNELASIVVTSTAKQGLEHWDTPDAKARGPSKGRMRKDRYSALLMANMGGRRLMSAEPVQAYEGAAGGFAGRVGGKRRAGESPPLYLPGAPAWWQQGLSQAGGLYGRALRPRGVRSRS